MGFEPRLSCGGLWSHCQAVSPWLSSFFARETVISQKYPQCPCLSAGRDQWTWLLASPTKIPGQNPARAQPPSFPSHLLRPGIQPDCRALKEQGTLRALYILGLFLTPALSTLRSFLSPVLRKPYLAVLPVNTRPRDG